MDVERRVTDRLVLRRITAADEAALVELHADPANSPYRATDGGPPTRARSAELARMFAAQWDRDGIGYWMVEHGDELAGVAGIVPTALGGRPCFNLYYRFVPAGRGRGFAAEACREALAVAAELEPDRPVVVRTEPENGPARRLAETLGLVRRAELDAGDGLVVYLQPLSPGV